MQINKILQKDYTLAQGFYQLKLPLNIDCIIPDNDSVRLLSQFVAEMDISDLFRTYFRIRKNTTTPRQMLKIMIYAYMNKIYSSRDIETACHRDINFMFLLEDSKAPDHATIARFRTLHFAPVSKKIMSEVSNYLYGLGEVSGESIFIDGTKIEGKCKQIYLCLEKGGHKKSCKTFSKPC